MASSPSEKLRREGNILYSQIVASVSEDSSSRFSRVLLTYKLDRCTKLYYRAMAESITTEEQASACKNIAMVNFLHLKALAQDSSSTQNMGIWKYHIFTSVDHFMEALRHGIRGDCKPLAWRDDLVRLFDSMVSWISQTSATLGLFRNPLLQALCNAIEDYSLQGQLDQIHHKSLNAVFCVAFKNYPYALFKETLLMEAPDDEFFMDYKKCSGLLHDSSLYLRKGRKFLVNLEAEGDGGSSLARDILDLEKSVQVHLCICEALQHIAAGDEALKRAVMEEEGIDMEYVKEALDYYRSAIRATKEMDMETEAIALSRIGKAYADTLKMKNTAHKFYFQALRLGLTVMSQRISESKWYKHSKAMVEAHQQRIAEEEKAKRERSREPAMERLKPKLSKLAMEANRSAESLLRFLYEEHVHPELKRNVVPVLDTKENVRKSLRTAILHYHPDTNGSYGEDWKVLCEEICKHLNSKYNLFKGVD